MPFDKTPAYSTYQTKSIALFKQQNNRGSNVTKDEDYLNVYIEQVKNKILQDLDQFIVKRPGTALYMDNANADTVVRGVHYNQDFKKLYYAIGSKMYVWDVASNVLS